MLKGRGFGVIFCAFKHGNGGVNVSNSDTFGETGGPTIFDVCFACEVAENFHVTTSEFIRVRVLTEKGIKFVPAEMMGGPTYTSKHTVVDVCEMSGGGSGKDVNRTKPTFEPLVVPKESRTNGPFVASKDKGVSIGLWWRCTSVCTLSTRGRFLWRLL